MPACDWRKNFFSLAKGKFSLQFCKGDEEGESVSSGKKQACGFPFALSLSHKKLSILTRSVVA
jgi:hypothetical protein